ncbi:MAG: oligosaccharide flippase family protein [Crocinitomicaceae bacterium]|nr:oligosaccharide flippase family protein [Crocinitomicaceae bacterium]
MLRDLIREGGLYTLANFLTKGISLFLIPFYTAYFSPSDFGVIDMFTVFGFFITGVMTLQLSQGLARYVAESTLKRKERIEFASTAIWFSGLSLMAAFVLLTVLSSFFINVLFEPGTVDVELYTLAVTSIIVNAFFLFIGVYFRFIRMTTVFSLLSFLHALFSILLTWLLVGYFKLGIESIYFSFLSVTPLLIITQLYLLRHRIKLTIKKDKIKKLLVYSLPLIPLTIATTVMNFTDRLFIKYYEGLDSLGIYAVGAKFSLIIAVVIGGFSMAIAPLVFQRHTDEQTKVELKKIFYLFFSVGTMGFLTLSLFSKETLVILTNEHYYDANAVMPFMYFTAIFVGLNMFSHGLYIEKRTGIMATITVIFASLNVLLNFILIPKYSIEGAAVATLIATIGQHSTLFLFSQKYYKIDLNYLKILITAAICFGSVLLFKYFSFENYFIELVIKIALIALFLIFLIRFDIFDYDRLRKFILRKLKVR